MMEKDKKKADNFVVYLLKYDDAKNVKIVNCDPEEIPLKMCVFRYAFDDVNTAKLWAELIRYGLLYREDLDTFKAMPTIEAIA